VAQVGVGGQGSGVRGQSGWCCQPRNITQQCKGRWSSEQKAQAEEPQAASSEQQFERSFARQTLPMHSL